MKTTSVVAPIVLTLSIALYGQTPAPSAAASEPAHNLPNGPVAVAISVDQAVAEALQSNPEIRAAVRRLSPVTMTSFNLSAWSSRMASAVVDLIGSATARIPAGLPSMATNTAVLPSS